MTLTIKDVEFWEGYTREQLIEEINRYADEGEFLLNWVKELLHKEEARA